MTELETLADRPTVLLTSYRRDGRAVTTPVNVAVEDGRAFVRTYEPSGKLKRIRGNPFVEVAPATWRGRAVGPPLRAQARLLEGDDAARASRLLGRKHPLLQGLLVPLGHRLRGLRTVHLELVPAESN